MTAYFTHIVTIIIVAAAVACCCLLLLLDCSCCRYGTFAYKALVRLPCVKAETYELALQDAAEEAARVQQKVQERRLSQADGKPAGRAPERTTYNVLTTADEDEQGGGGYVA